MSIRIIIDLENAEGYGNPSEPRLDPKYYSSFMEFIRHINEGNSKVKHKKTRIETDIEGHKVKTVYKFKA